MAGPVRKFKETLEMRETPLTRLRSHPYFSIGLVLFAVLLVACVHIWQRVHVIRLVREVGDLAAENRSLVDATKKVQTEIAALSMASRIESFAADSLALAPIAPDRVFTLVRELRDSTRPDEFAEMITSIKRVTEYLPVLTETQAGAAELKPIRFDSVNAGRSGQ
ncbi:MAG: cell division protein FtsL [Candidatus Zixiibacteriota bacterium]